MTLATLSVEDPRDDQYLLAGTGPYGDPFCTVVDLGSPSTVLSDGNDATYVQLDRGNPVLLYAPHFIAHVPILQHVETVTSVTLNLRVAVTGNAYSTVETAGYFTTQLFRWLGGGDLPDPYEVLATVPVSSHASSQTRDIGFTTLSLSMSGVTPDDLESGQLWLRVSHDTPFGGSTLNLFSEASLTVDYVREGIAPLRQWPRDDGLRSNARRYGISGPSSRQGSIRRGPAGTYT